MKQFRNFPSKKKKIRHFKKSKPGSKETIGVILHKFSIIQ